jgi:putative tricarboxylic transport membrane protein
MPKVDRWCGIILLVFSFLTAYWAWKIPLGSAHRPGPGFFPLLLSFVLAFLAFLLLIAAWIEKLRAKPAEAPLTRREARKPLYILVVLLIYAASFQGLGFLLSTFLFLVLLKPVVGKKWPYVLTGAALATILSYLVFEVGLQSQLPKGFLGI